MKLDLTKPMALPEAVRSLGARTPVGTALRTAELEGLPLALRKNAFFSAGVESARFLERAKRSIDKSISQFGVNRDRASFVKEMQDLATELGIRPTDGTRGTIMDIGSARRLRLIYDVQTAMARNEADWRDGQQPAVLNAYPAQELLRVEDREEPRDWPQRWRDAGGQFFDGGRMVALKVDPIWIAISRFDQPWPPFDFGSGMGVRDVRRREAVELGLLARGQRLEPVAPEYDARIEAGMQGLSEPVAVGLQTFFGRTAETSRDGKRIAMAVAQAPSLRGIVHILADTGDDTRSAIYEALSAADSVMGDGTSPWVGVVEAVLPKGKAGKYSASWAQKGPPPLIVLDPDKEDLAISFLHELGHWIDNWGLHEPGGGRVYASDHAAELEELIDALKKSRAARDILKSRSLSEGDKNYYLRPRELFARAYAQFIIEESGHPKLRKAMEDLRRGDLSRLEWWSKADFSVIRQLLRALFQTRNWTR